VVHATSFERQLNIIAAPRGTNERGCANGIVKDFIDNQKHFWYNHTVCLLDKEDKEWKTRFLPIRESTNSANLI
jgi:hypothetical protein